MKSPCLEVKREEMSKKNDGNFQRSSLMFKLLLKEIEMSLLSLVKDMSKFYKKKKKGKEHKRPAKAKMLSTNKQTEPRDLQIRHLSIYLT